MPHYQKGEIKKHKVPHYHKRESRKHKVPHYQKGEFLKGFITIVIIGGTFFVLRSNNEIRISKC